MDTAIKQLRQRHPWPDQEPNVPEDWHGWLFNDTLSLLYNRLTTSTNLVVECGSWLGMSDRAMLFGAPNAMLVCCDHWQGSPDHKENPDWSRRLDTLYETFLRNMWPWRDRVIPIRADTLEGLGEVRESGIVPDLIYLDSEHTFDRVSRELAFCSEHWPTTPVVGDDYHWPGVARAAHEHARRTGRCLCAQGTGFSIL
jgi:hypothetical protein